jgi:Ion channel
MCLVLHIEVAHASLGHWTGAAAGGRGAPLGSPAWPSSTSNKVTPMPRIATLLPLAVGASTVVCTILLHALAVSATIHCMRYGRTHGYAGTSVWNNLALVTLVIAFAFVAHLLAIAVWAVVFLLCGEFPTFGTAYYHSAVNYTTLGYGDVIMTPSWQLLGPLEAANGALMFGVSTALIFAVLQRLIEARLVAPRD